MRKIKFIKCKVHSVRHTSLTFNWVKSCNWTEVNSEPAHFRTFMNSATAFPSLDDMQLPVTWPNSASTKLLESQIILLTPGIIWTLKLKAKGTEYQFVEQPTPTLNKISSYKRQIMSNHYKIISLASLPGLPIWDSLSYIASKGSTLSGSLV